MKKHLGQIVVGVLAIAALLAGGYLYLQQQPEVISLVSVVADLKAGQIARIAIDGNDLYVTYTSGEEVLASKEPETSLVEQLAALGVQGEALAGVEIVFADPHIWGDFREATLSFLKILVPGLAIIFLLKKAPSMASFSFFGDDSAQIAPENRPLVTFADVAGVDEAKLELEEVVTFLKEPEKFQKIGARTPKGVLLIGPPGTGKTLLAKAVAGESQVPFFNMSGSEFSEMYVGVGARRVRKLFAEAKRHSPSIIFIDELDAVGRHRDASPHGSGERDQTLNQILVEIDGFESDAGIVVIGATNRPDVLDKALLRAGRFDRQVTLSAPDIKGREETFLIHLADKPLDEGVDVGVLARMTPGFVGADIENVVNEAAILAVRYDKEHIGPEEFDAAIERVMAGPEKRGRIISAEERRLVAYHELGHAIVAHVLEHCDPLKKVSMLPRGAAAGYTLTMPEEDHYVVTRAKLLDDLAFVLGGRAAEEVIFGDVTTGASNDLMRATDVARKMVTHYGMSSLIGPLSYSRTADPKAEEPQRYSEEKARQIDDEIKRLVEEAYARAQDVVRSYRLVMDRLAEALFAQETLSAESFATVFDEALRAQPAA